MSSWVGLAAWPVLLGLAWRRLPRPATSAPKASPAADAQALPQARLFDEGPSFSEGGAVTLTVFARGRLTEPVTLKVSSSQGGRFSKTVLILAAGDDSSDSFSFVPEANRVTTLSYSGHPNAPAARQVYSLSDPVAHAQTDLDEGACAILARYGASKWVMADGFGDIGHDRPAADGEALHVVADSGFGASRANAMDMLNWLDSANSTSSKVRPPVLRTLNGRKCSDHSARHTWGFWCKKPAVDAGLPSPSKHRVPYHLHDPHFAIVALAVPDAVHSGVAFQASRTHENHTTELAIADNRPQARWVDARGQQVVLTSPHALTPQSPAVLALTSQPGRQTLRIDGQVAGTAAARLGAGPFGQILIGWGFRNYFPDDGFEGQIFSVVTGKGVPSDDELRVLERYLAQTAGIAL